MINSDHTSGGDTGGNIKRRFPVWIPVVIVVICLATFLIWLFQGRSRGASSGLLPEVKVVVADTSRVEVFGEYDGSIRALQTVEVTARVEGVLEKMLFKEGSYVRKGQVLFVIDPKLYQAQVDRARAELDRAKALKDKAVRDLDRIRPLFIQKAASQLDLDNAEAALECAEAEVEISKVDLLEAQVTLGYTRVVAPISGYISERTVDVGALVGPGSRAMLATIVRSDTVMVDFSMTSRQYLAGKDRNINIRCDDGECLDHLPFYVTITLADGNEYPYRGVVDFADPMIDPKTGTFSVRAEVPNPDQRLLPGEKTKVKVLEDVLEHALTVPVEAVVDETAGKYVYTVAADGSVDKRSVSLGVQVGNRVVVLEGLAPGEMVAIDRFELLSESVVVKPVVVSGNGATEKAASPSEGKK